MIVYNEKTPGNKIEVTENKSIVLEKELSKSKETQLSVDQKEKLLIFSKMEMIRKIKNEGIAIINFVNNTILNSEKYDIISKQIAEMLYTALAQSEKVKMLERSQIESICMNEMKLSLSGLTDEKQTLRLGQILSAKGIIAGSFSVMGKQILINTRLIDVETGRALLEHTSGAIG